MLKTFAEFSLLFPFIMIGISTLTGWFIMGVAKRFAAVDWESMPQGERIMAQIVTQVHIMLYSLPIVFCMICFGIWVIAICAKISGAI